MRPRMLAFAIAAAVALSALAIVETAHAGDNVTLEQVPPAVRKTIEEVTRGAIIEEIEQETNKHGVVYYEVEYERDGQEWELEVDLEGAIIKHERD